MPTPRKDFEYIRKTMGNKSAKEFVKASMDEYHKKNPYAASHPYAKGKKLKPEGAPHPYAKKMALKARTETNKQGQARADREEASFQRAFKKRGLNNK